MSILPRQARDKHREKHSKKSPFCCRPTSPLCTVRCAPFNHGGAALLIGDAAHAIVPFYGQGCNSAFEDVSLLDKLWEEHKHDTAEVFRAFSDQRK
jgi:kynurenine 3-monooxygenase|eukprot:COSAG06_NODE_1211_length_10245_cov_5.120244_6_plen_96_part_00